MKPPSAELIRKTAQIAQQPGCEAESGAEAGDGFNPGFRIGANSQQNRLKIRIYSSPFVRPHHPSRLVHEIKIFSFGHLEDSASSGF